MSSTAVRSALHTPGSHSGTKVARTPHPPSQPSTAPRASKFSRTQAVTLKVPDTLNVGCVSVSSRTAATFSVKNKTSETIAWLGEVPQPFTLEPRFGEIPAGQSTSVTLTFSPQTAGIFDGECVIKFDGGTAALRGSTHTSIKGAAKYPFVMVDAMPAEPNTAATFNAAGGSTGAQSATQLTTRSRRVSRRKAPKSTRITANNGTVRRSALATQASSPAIKSTNGSREDPVTQEAHVPPVPTAALSTVDVPCQLDFGSCAVGATDTKSIIIRNMGEVDAHFSLNHSYIGAKPSFGLVDPPGTLPAGTTATIPVTFTPTRVGAAYHEAFEFAITAGPTLRVELAGNADKPEVSVSRRDLVFGTVLVDTTRTATITLTNTSDTDSIVSLPPQDLGAFQLATTSPSSSLLTIKPFETLDLTVLFKPQHPITYFEQLYIHVLHQPPIVLHVLGHGASVQPDFLAVAEGSDTIDTLSSVLVSQELEQLQKYVALASASRQPLSHYPPSTFSQLQEAKAIVYDTATETWTVAMPPTQDEQDAIAPSAAPAAGGGERKKRATPGGASVEPPASSLSPADSMPQLVAEMRDPTTCITISDTLVDFGVCPSGSKKLVATIAPHTLTLTNNTTAPIACFWHTPTATDELPTAFEIVPSTATVEPGDTSSFTVTFRPATADTLFHETFVCYSRFVECLGSDDSRVEGASEDAPLCSGWTQQLFVVGDTHPPPDTPAMSLPAEVPKAKRQVPQSPAGASGKKSKAPLRSVSPPDEAEEVSTITRIPSPLASMSLSFWDSPTLHFAPCAVGSSIYATATITNDGKAPGVFSSRAVAGFVCVAPSRFLLPGETRLLTFQMSSDQPGTVQVDAILTCINNVSPHLEFSASGVFYAPSLSTSPSALTCGVTCQGVETSCALNLSNPTPITLYFRLEFASQDQGSSCSFHLDMTHGELEPNEHVLVPLRLTATECGSFDDAVLAYFGSDANKLTQSITVPVEGYVEVPTLKAALQPLKAHVAHGVAVAGAPLVASTSDNVIELGGLVVDERVQFRLSVTNTSDVIAYFALTQDLGNSIRFLRGNKKLNIPPHCTQYVDFQLSPNHEGEDVFTVSAELQDAAGQPLALIPLAQCAFTGIKPKLAISDVRSETTTTVQLWQRLNIDAINKALAPRPNLAIDGQFDFEFGCSSHLEPDSVVVVELTNTSTCECMWSASLPTDSKWKGEQWSHLAPETEEDATYEFIAEEKIFDVQPRQGTLAPGASCALTFTYKHSFVDVHTIPLLLRQNLSDAVVVLNLSGKTIATGNPFVQLASDTHEFDPVSIATSFPPVQHMHLFNPGDVPARYYIDTEALVLHTQRNYGMSIFECGQIEGTIPPKTEGIIPWQFHPIQARTYEVLVPIHIEGMQESPLLVTFRGRGVDPREEKQRTRRTTMVAQLEAGTGPRRTLTEDDLDKMAARSTSSSSIMTLPEKGPPRVPRLVLQGQLASLSSDVVDFGKVCLHSISRQLLFLQSRSESVARFEWDLGDYADIIAVLPPKGLVYPGESVMCTVEFRATDGVRMYDASITCSLTDEQEALAFDEYKQRVETEREVQSQLFTYTDKVRTGRGHAGAVDVKYLKHPKTSESAMAMNMDATLFPEKVLDAGAKNVLAASLSRSLEQASRSRPPSGNRKLQPVTGAKKVVVHDTDLRTTKYQALPPIRIKPDERAQTPADAIPVFKLHVHVSSHVVNETELDDDTVQFVDRQMGQIDDDTRMNVQQLVELAGEGGVIEDVLLSMVREAISDARFLSAVYEVEGETTPSFLSIKEGLGELEEVGGQDAVIYLPSHLAFVESILDETLRNTLAELEEDSHQAVSATA
eukprot:m.189946 g.189946  ORF g.189946 m.189946 type:complete len:1840 (+) comp14803_c0_seq8:44-5563(+)